MATIEEIAVLAKVSQATVSRVLNQDETLSVTPEVRQKIIKIANELKYIPPKMRRMKKEQSLIIGVADWHLVRSNESDIHIVIPELTFLYMLQGADVSFQRMFYGKEVKVDGIVAFGTFKEDEIAFLKKQSRQILFVNSNQMDYEYDCIVMDYDKGMQDMVSYLLDEKEYRSIGYIGGLYEEGEIHIGVRRKNSLKRILEERGLYEERYFKIGELSQESGYQMVKELLQKDDVPEVLVLGNGEIAEGALDAVKEMKYRIPKDIAVVIYRDIETVETKYPSYTNLKMVPDMVWTMAVKLLMESIREGRTDMMKIYLPAKLEKGDSA